ncbi:hypothetical protein WR25_23587 [Diploscapter pachys]|uniref:Uncharacterized protein n=1 Tax=Diploscapter pachys TaxID=2018661 RepID=A0A2A2L2X2_9BILA|nr:hypothetical protein WR25_23587 [Diploscapter pachys]
MYRKSCSLHPSPDMSLGSGSRLPLGCESGDSFQGFRRESRRTIDINDLWCKRNLCLSGPIRADVGSFLPTNTNPLGSVLVGNFYLVKLPTNSGQVADRLGSTRIELPIWAERHTDRQFTELSTRPDPPG